MLYEKFVGKGFAGQRRITISALKIPESHGKIHIPELGESVK